jgi:outer membrane receptor protein involved in Fe transport
MPANQIERVEVITNPSAAMSPEGSGGVINLVTRKTRAAGASGTLRANAGPEGRGSLTVNGSVNRPGTTLSGEAGIRRFTNEIDVEQTRERTDAATGATLVSRQDSTFENVARSTNARIGIERDLDKTNRLTGDISFREGQIDSERQETYLGNELEPGFQRLSDIDMNQRVVGLRSSWRKTLPGKDHALVLEGELDRVRLRRGIDGRNILPSEADQFERIENNGDIGQNRLKLDYKRPLGEGRSLNLGYEGELSDSEFEFLGARGLSRGSLLPLPGLTNNFDFKQMVHALYGTYQLNSGTWEFQPGLRLEQVDLDLFQRTEGTRFEQDYFRLYPTLHVGRAFGERHKLRASYSRRIQRPGALELNPYLFYVDPRNVRRGNPELKPETTDAYELAWQYRKDATFLSLTSFYRRQNDGFTDLVETLADGTLLTTRANLASGNRLGVDAILNGRLSKQLSYNLSGTVQRVELDTGLLGFEEVADTVASGRANVTWQPSPNDFFQVNGSYSGRQPLPQGYRLSGGVLNFGYRRKINDRFSLLLTGQNVLDTARQVVVIRTPVLRDRLEQKVQGRLIMAGFSWNFGGTSNRRRPDQGFDFDPSATSVAQ